METKYTVGRVSSATGMMRMFEPCLVNHLAPTPRKETILRSELLQKYREVHQKENLKAFTVVSTFLQHIFLVCEFICLSGCSLRRLFSNISQVLELFFVILTNSK